MVKDSLRGRMVESLMEIISTENAKEEESLFGQIKKSMMAFGRKDCNMERVFIVTRNRRKGMVLGIWGSLLNGYDFLDKFNIMCIQKD